MCWGMELKSERKVIGRIYLYDIVGSESAGYRADVGYSVSAPYWRQGYAAEALRRIVNYGFSSLRVIRFQAEIMPENTASLRVCEKAGFHAEGTLRKYAFYSNNGNCFRDIVLMALTDTNL